MVNLKINGIYRLIMCLPLLLFFLTPASGEEKIIGVMMPGDVPYYTEIHKALLKELTNEGVLVKGKVEIVVQSPSDDPMSLVNAARKLVAIGSSVIISYGTPATLAAMNETSDIPIVFAAVSDPYAFGIVGRNVTGISSKTPLAFIMKQFKSILNFSKLGVVYSDTGKEAALQIKEIRQLEGALGFHSVRLSTRTDIDAWKIANVDAIFLTTQCISTHCVRQAGSIARKARIPIASATDEGEDSSILLAITANAAEQGTVAAREAARVLKGEKPSSIQIAQPRKVDTVINLKGEADAGLKIPFELATSATRIKR